MKDKDGSMSLKDEDYGLLVMRIGHEYKTARHNHDFFEIVIVEQGFSMHRVEEDMSLLIPGDIIILSPGIRHEYWKSVNNVVYNCLVYPETLGEDIQELKKLPLFDALFAIPNACPYIKTNLKLDIRFEAFSVLKKMVLECEKKPLGWKVRLKALFVVFMVFLSRTWSENENLCQDEKVNTYMPTNGMIGAMELSASNKTNISEIACSVGYSPEHFSRSFKKMTGLSPSSYIITKKIAAAAERLLESNVSITKAAELSGFTDLNYFSRRFKKETGKTPSEFRASREI